MWSASTRSFSLGFTERKKRTPPHAKSKKSAPELQLKKVEARLRILDRPVRAIGKDLPITFFLNDLGLTEARFFSPLNLPTGTRVAIVMSSPKTFYAHGRIVWTYESTPDSKIIRQDKNYRYRSSIRLEFETEAEKKQIKEFFSQIQKSLHIELAAV